MRMGQPQMGQQQQFGNQQQQPMNMGNQWNNMGGQQPQQQPSFGFS
jgi:hypothetical protein